MKLRTLLAALTLLLILLTGIACTQPSSLPSTNPESSVPNTTTPSTVPSTIPQPTPKTAITLIDIIIYTDFQCGACGKFNSEVEPELRERYVATGKAQIETCLLGALGVDSVLAAEAALCAADQGCFFEYKDALFRAWRETDVDDPYSPEELVKLAGSLGLDEEAFQRCLENGSKGLELETNMSLAEAADIRTLPAVIIDGTKVEGYHPPDIYITRIERAIANQTCSGVE
jgi:protein-disulfide isomerase